jgi:hypothetical protein
LRLPCAATLLAALACCSAAATEDVIGTWAGSGRITNDWHGSACVYAGTATPPSVILEMLAEGRATLTLEIPAAVESACPPLKKRYEIQGVAISDASIAFRDPAGHEWTLARREGGLKGMVAWKPGAADEALAQGFSVGSDVPMLRLSGELELRRSDAPRAAQAAATGSAIGGLVSVLGANVVGVGALVLANRALQDDKGTTSVNATCSLRNCIGDCVCENTTFVSGQSCGNLPGGVGLNQACNVPTRPCQSQLSCNNGICQDQAGLCPF